MTRREGSAPGPSNNRWSKLPTQTNEVREIRVADLFIAPEALNASIHVGARDAFVAKARAAVELIVTTDVRELVAVNLTAVRAGSW